MADKMAIILILPIILGATAGLMFFFIFRLHRGMSKKLDSMGKWHQENYKCPICENIFRYQNERLPTNLTCSRCGSPFFLTTGEISFVDYLGRHTYKKTYVGLKTKPHHIGTNNPPSNIGNYPNTFCSKCGYSLNYAGGASFCPSCGNQLP